MLVVFVYKIDLYLFENLVHALLNQKVPISGQTFVLPEILYVVHDQSHCNGWIEHPLTCSKLYSLMFTRNICSEQLLKGCICLDWISLEA